MLPRAAVAVAAVAIAAGGTLAIVAVTAGGDEPPATAMPAARPTVSGTVAAPTAGTLDTPDTRRTDTNTTVGRGVATSTTGASSATSSASSSTAPPSTTTLSGPTIAAPSTYAAGIDVLAPRDVAVPVNVLMPSLGVDGRVEPTGINERAELAVPADARTLVWYQYGPSPGEPGSAVIAGHVDWKGVLGIFHQLANTPVGADVTVVYDDASERSFTVTSVELVDKPAVAVNDTFARRGESVLRLVTCGGEFDDEVNSYYSNVVVTAVPT